MIRALGRKFELVDPSELPEVAQGEDICKHCDYYKLGPHPLGHCFETPCGTEDYCVLREVRDGDKK